MFGDLASCVSSRIKEYLELSGRVLSIGVYTITIEVRLVTSHFHQQIFFTLHMLGEGLEITLQLPSDVVPPVSAFFVQEMNSLSGHLIDISF